MDPLPLLRALIACPSVTPARGAVFDVAEAALAGLGFAVTRTLDGPEPVENLVATRRPGHGAPPAATSPSPATWTWCRRAAGGAATRSAPACRTAGWSDAARAT